MGSQHDCEELVEIYVSDCNKGTILTSDAERIPSLLSRKEADDSFGSSDDQGDNSSTNQHSPKEAPLANRETRAVTKWKLVVLAVLLLSAIGTALCVYYYIRNSETAKFQEAFHSSAIKVLEVVGLSFETALKSLDSLAVAFVSEANISNQTFPFVTVPDFPILAAKMISNSDAFVVTFWPLIANELREQWEQYSVTHSQWVNASVRLQQDYAFYHGPLEFDTSNYDGVIYGDLGPIEYDVE